MKKIIAYIFFTLVLFSSAFSQTTFQATIKKGSAANSVYIVIKPNADIAGQISSMQFAISIPESISPDLMPGYTITSLVTGLTYGGTGIQTTEETAAGVLSYVYTFSGVGDATVPVTNYVGGTEYNIAEVFLLGDGLLTSVKLIQLPNGGTTQNSNFYMALGGVEVENTTAQFYGAGAVNDGQSFSGTSYVTITDVLLPVKFLSFYAIKSGDDAKLSWTVGSDDENKYFDIERSTNARSYTPFARVNALGNGSSINTYEAADMLISKLGSKELYYRIKQVDKSGVSVYSVIRNLNVNQSSLGISLYPNPARSISKLIVDAPAPSKAVIILRDMTGKQMQIMNTQFVKGINQKDINVGNLPAGDYNISVLSDNLNQTIKLSKLN
ncbi:MAG: T9SS type A sorting domain-containing protein [Bacteroidota bacterium]